MDWKFIFQLSLLGLIMAFGTISLIPNHVEPFFWLVIFVFCAYMVAKVCTGRYFLHGFMVSIFNSVYITAAHAIFYTTYIAHHPEMTTAGSNMPMQDHPVLFMIILGPVLGAAFGLVQGLFAFIASKLVKKNTPST